MIVYKKNQVIGRYGCKYIKELAGIPRVSGRGNPFTERHALFECGMCGKAFKAHIGKVKCGWTKSCGCRKLTSDGISCLPSGERNPLHIAWSRMISRCHDPKDIGYKNYGARGISVCSEWQESFKAFRDWALVNKYQHGLQIDRINNDGNYEPNNCRFVTNIENSKNKRNNKHCWLNGEKLIFTDAAKKIGVSRNTIAAWARKSTGTERKKPAGLVFEEPANV